MGYRSTIITEDFPLHLPPWFVDKYQESYNLGEYDSQPSLPISSRYETKFYQGAQQELFVDIAKVLQEQPDGVPSDITCALLHEDGRIDRVVIGRNRIELTRSLEDPDDGYSEQLGDSESYEF